MEVLAENWSKLTTPESIAKAFRRCGISNEGLSFEWMQKDKMAAQPWGLGKICGGNF